MTHPIPYADPLPLPAPPTLLWVLLQAMFLLHTVAMNLLVGGAILALAFRFSRDAATAAQRGAFLALFAKSAPVLMAATVNLGVATLLFVQVLYGRLFFTSSILMGVVWLAVVPILIAVYYGLYVLALRGERESRWAVALGIAATLLLVLVALIYTANMSLMLRPEAFLEKYRADGLGLRLPIDDPALVPRYLHTLLSAVAVAALAVALVGLARRARDEVFGAWAVRHGLIWFGTATAANVVVGLWYLLAQPRTTLVRLVSQDGGGMALLALSLILPFLLVGAVPFALRATPAGRGVKHIGLTLAATLIVMVLLRDEVRQAALVRVGYTLPGWVEPQWGAIAIFAALAVSGLVVVGWMVRALVRGRGSG